MVAQPKREYPTLEQIVEMLKLYGVRVWHWEEAVEGTAVPTHLVKFWGGDSDGMKAVAIAVTRGLKIEHLKRVWSFWDNNKLQGNGSWELTIHVNDGLH